MPLTAATFSVSSPSITKLRVEGMTCTNCARQVGQALRSLPGVQSATVELEAGRAIVRWSAGTPPNVEKLVSALKQRGFQAAPLHFVSGQGDLARPPLLEWRLNLMLGLPVMVWLMMGEWFLDWGMTPWFRWMAWVLAVGVQFFAGARFYRGAWNQLKAGNSNMDTLVSLGSSTAFAYSTWVLLSGAGGHVYFMESVSIITLISLGHWLEVRISAHAAGTLKQLLQLAPPTARRLVRIRPMNDSAGQFNIRSTKFSTDSTLQPPAFGLEEEIAVAGLCVGDLVVLRPGDRVPVDGVVSEGGSAVDEAMLTGESIPVDKSFGNALFAGTVNLNGRLIMRVSATGDATALAHIIAAVERAQSSRADIQRLGDRVSSVFVPIVTGVAIVAGLAWGLASGFIHGLHDGVGAFLPWHMQMMASPWGTALMTAAAVLIVACPCAMGLATPVAIMAGSNAAARRGILIRDGVALEKAGRVTAVVFDKTGTLTLGKPEVAGEWVAAISHRSGNAGSKGRQGLESVGSGVQAERGITASLARHSSHPVSQALAKLSSEEVPVTDWIELPGAGVEGGISSGTGQSSRDERKARLGALRWLEEAGVDISKAGKFISEWSDRGATLVGLAVGMELCGVFALKDTVKPGAAKVIADLRRQGLRTFLISGDHALTTLAVARQVGIEAARVFAQIRPEGKAEFVKGLQLSGERVAFVGDGLNDAPALEQADLGIAVSRASDLARESADIILLNSEIEAVPESLALARATLQTIKQNLFWAFFYNALGVPLAALGFMSPILCAVAMGASDLIVIGNALRLIRWRVRR